MIKTIAISIDARTHPIAFIRMSKYMVLGKGEHYY
jgi:hypothetical protein